MVYCIRLLASAVGYTITLATKATLLIGHMGVNPHTPTPAAAAGAAAGCTHLYSSSKLSPLAFWLWISLMADSKILQVLSAGWWQQHSNVSCFAQTLTALDPTEANTAQGELSGETQNICWLSLDISRHNQGLLHVEHVTGWLLLLGSGCKGCFACC
jgi:hypothetical protein